MKRSDWALVFALFVATAMDLASVVAQGSSGARLFGAMLACWCSWMAGTVMAPLFGGAR